VECPNCKIANLKHHSDSEWIACESCNQEFRILDSFDAAHSYFERGILWGYGIETDHPLNLEEIIMRLQSRERSDP
jgi:hypothetical protein